MAGRGIGGAALLAAALVALLGGCAATGPAVPGPQAQQRPALSADQYRTLQATLRESSSARAQLTRECVRGTDEKPAEAKRGMAIMLDVPSAEVPQVFCERFLAAVRAGRLTYEDYLAVQFKDDDEFRMRRLVNVLRDPSLSPTI
ncbi:MAG TPA: hypothetical protein VF606_00955 [Geminicoccaceae bacterium]